MAGDVRVVVDRAAVQAMGRDLGVSRGLLEMAGWVADRAYVLAPKDTGAGAGSIRPEAVLDGPMWTVRVAWDQDHYYMIMHERGTVHLPARPFLEPALEAIVR